LLTHDPAFRDADVYSYSYDSPWLRKGLNIDELADDMHLRLADQKIVENHDRLVFVCHSMGGLVTRAFLVKYQSDVREKLAFLYFFATPSSGSELATIGRVFLPNTQLADMSPGEGDRFLLDLQTRWLVAKYGRSVPSYCAYETEPIGPTLVVNWSSAFGLCNEGVIAIDGTHTGIVKPVDLDSKSHVALRTAYRDSMGAESRRAVRLVAGRALKLSYRPNTGELLAQLTGAVGSLGGAADIIDDIYGRLDTVPAGLAYLPITTTDVYCDSNGRALVVPFSLGGGDITCEVRARLGELSGPVFETPGPKRLTISFETDQSRGHDVEFCFYLTSETLTDLKRPLDKGVRFLNARCEEDQQ
jgi:hypothetical protein